MDKVQLWLVSDEGDVVLTELWSTNNPKVYTRPAPGFLGMGLTDFYLLGEQCFNDQYLAYSKGVEVLEGRIQEMHVQQNRLRKAMVKMEEDGYVPSGC